MPDQQFLASGADQWSQRQHPLLSPSLGDLYYEGKEFETRLREKKPGDLSDELRRALGMPTGMVRTHCTYMISSKNA